MAVSLPIVSEFNAAGIKRAVAEFKQLEGAGKKAQFAIKKAAVPAGLAVAALGGFLVTAAKGAEEARQANQRLGNVLESMGFGEATDRVAAYAESLEKTIAVDADVIKATQTKLATFAGLTKTVNEAGGAFDRATLAALDMAAAGFGTAEGNAVQLGKALENPIKGIAALAKSGVTFTDQEKEKIKTLVESNKLLEAQDMVLAAIEKQVGGTSKASASSFDKMKFSLAGISDTFGELVLPAIDKFAVLLAGVSVFVAENEKLVAILVLTVGGLALAVLAVNAAMKVFNAVMIVGKVVVAAFNFVLAANPITLVVLALAALVAAFVIAYKTSETFRNFINGLFSAIKTGVITSVDFLKGYLNTVLGFYKGIFDGIVSAVNTVLGLIGKLVGAIRSIPSLPNIGGAVGGLIGRIPGLADGGIVTRPTLAMIGERGPEAVIPLNRGGMGGNITVNIHSTLADASLPDKLVNALRQYNRRSGVIDIRVA
jgi:phage-related protein